MTRGVVLGAALITLKALESLEVDSIDQSTRVTHKQLTSKLLEGLQMVQPTTLSIDSWKQVCNLVVCADELSAAKYAGNQGSIDAAFAEYDEAVKLVLMAIDRMRTEAGLGDT